MLVVYTPYHLCSTLSGLLGSSKWHLRPYESWITGSSCVVPQAENTTWSQLEYFFSKSNFMKWLECNMRVIKLHKLKWNLFSSSVKTSRSFKVLFLHSGHLTLHREPRGRMKFEVTLENWCQKTATGFVLIYLLWGRFSLGLSHSSSSWHKSSPSADCGWTPNELKGH